MVGPPVTGVHGSHPTALKNTCALLNMYLVPTASQCLRGLWILPRGCSPVLCCVNKGYDADAEASSQPLLRDLRGRESVRSSCAGSTRERGSSHAPKRFAGHTARAGGLLRSGRRTVLPGPSHLTCLFFVFVTIYVGHQHKRENSGKTNAF